MKRKYWVLGALLAVVIAAPVGAVFADEARRPGKQAAKVAAKQSSSVPQSPAPGGATGKLAAAAPVGLVATSSLSSRIGALLAGFEKDREGWDGVAVLSGGPWSTPKVGSDAQAGTDDDGWASQGAKALQGDVTLDPKTESRLRKIGKFDLSKGKQLSIDVRMGRYGQPQCGTAAALYVKSGATFAWAQSAEQAVGVMGLTLTLDISKIAKPAEVTEIGVKFRFAAGASGKSQTFVDNLVLSVNPATPPPVVAAGRLAGFEGAETPAWSGCNVTDGPRATAGEWTAGGSSHSLKANIDLAAHGANRLTLIGQFNLNGRRSLTAHAAIAPWGNFAAGSTARLYIKSGPTYKWHEGARVKVTKAGATLEISLTGLGDLSAVWEIGVVFEHQKGASGKSAIYLDQVDLS